MKLLIAGSRDFNDRIQFDVELLQWVAVYGWPKEVVSGNCLTGADAFGEKWARDIKAKLTLFPADWKTHGRAAGPIRNKEMAKYCDFALLFWDGKSRGTLNMIQELFSLNKNYKTILY